MTDHPTTIDPTLLLEQSGWVLRLAHNLVRDPYGADDVAQETLLAALAAPPGDAADARRLRAWLGRVAFNLAHLATRRGFRRRAREEEVAQTERLHSAAAEVIRNSVLRGVTDAVGDLAEPYRTAVRLRYFEGLTTANIARETETSESAVRKRLWRARGQLRRALDSRHNGERQAWFQALAPIGLGVPGLELAGSTASAAGASTGASSFTGSTGTLAVGALKVAAGLLVVALAGAGWFATRDSIHSERTVLDGVAHAASSVIDVHGDAERVATARFPLVAPQVGEDARDPARDPVRRSGGAKRIRSGDRRVEPKSDAPPQGFAVSGSLVDLWGQPLGGATIFAAGEPNVELGLTDAGGRFTIRTEALPVTLRARAVGYETMRAAAVGVGEQEWEQWIVAAPTVDIDGFVVDPSGIPVRGATLEVAYDASAFVRLPVPLDVRSFDAPRVTSDIDGAIAIARVPTGRGIALRAAHPDFITTTSAVPDFPTHDWVIVLDPATPAHSMAAIAGVVTDDAGVPVIGARVALGEREVQTDASGRFRLQVEDEVRDAWLVADKPGFEPATTHVPSEPSPVHLKLGGTLTTIEGTIRDKKDSDLSNWVVFASLVPDEEGQTIPYPEGVHANPDGSFAVEGVRDKRYDVFAVDTSSFASTSVTETVGGMSGVDLAPRVSGKPVRTRLVDSKGESLAYVRFTAELPVRSTGGMQSLLRESSLSDGGGWVSVPDFARHARLVLEHPLFGEIRTVEPAELFIRFSPPAAMLATGTPDAPDVPDRDADASVVVANAPEIAVVLPSAMSVHSRTATAFGLLDAEGGLLRLAGSASSSTIRPLFGGDSGVFVVDPAAETIVWYDDDGEMSREPVRLISGEFHSVTQVER